MNFKTFSQRDAERRGIVLRPTHATFSPHLRQQITDIFHETIGDYHDNEHIGIGNDYVATTEFWKLYERYVRREVPAYLKYLAELRTRRYTVMPYHSRDGISRFIRDGDNASVLDVLDIGITLIHNNVRSWQR